MNIYYFIDGVYSSFVFLYYLIHNYRKEQVIEQTNNIYILPFLERFLLYTFLESVLPIHLGFVFIIPSIQNIIFEKIY